MYADQWIWLAVCRWQHLVNNWYWGILVILEVAAEDGIPLHRHQYLNGCFRCMALLFLSPLFPLPTSWQHANTAHSRLPCMPKHPKPPIKKDKNSIILCSPVWKARRYSQPIDPPYSLPALQAARPSPHPPISPAPQCPATRNVYIHNVLTYSKF